jgi:hypothetical protein
VEKGGNRIAFIRDGAVAGTYAKAEWQAASAEVEIVTGGLNPGCMNKSSSSSHPAKCYQKN